MSDEAWEGSREPGTRKPWVEVAFGVLLVPLMHGFAGGLIGGGAMLLDSFGVMGGTPVVGWPGMFALSLSISQLGYVGPAFLIAYRVRKNVAAGIAIGALLTVSLQGACYGAFCFLA